MIKKRIIPCLDVRNGIVVKGVKFEGIREVASPVELAKKYYKDGADELVFYDITASHENRLAFTDIVKEVAKNIFIPFTVGGGIKELKDFDIMLKSGADKVSVNSSAITNPNLIKEASRKYGSQCVVLSIDTKWEDGKYTVYTHGGRTKTDLDAIEWAIKGTQLGAGEICLNSIDTDGVKEGFNIDLLNKICSVVSVPVIASGGAGSSQDFTDVFDKTDCDAALAASVFHFDEIKIQDLKSELNENGIAVRL